MQRGLVASYLVSRSILTTCVCRNKTTTRFLGSLICATKPRPHKLKLPVRIRTPLALSDSDAIVLPHSSRVRADSAWLSIIDRKKVLKHHPDKKAGQSHTTNDDAFFKCIQKAHEVLTHPERRRQFDSVDPRFLALEEDVPTAADFKGNKANDDAFFFKSWAPVYEMEARFSKKTPVPLLGSFDDPKEKVEAFYDFWYTFDSWRSFEYLDKEVNEGSDRLVVVSFFLLSCPLSFFPHMMARG